MYYQVPHDTDCDNSVLVLLCVRIGATAGMLCPSAHKHLDFEICYCTANFVISNRKFNNPDLTLSSKLESGVDKINLFD